MSTITVQITGDFDINLIAREIRNISNIVTLSEEDLMRELNPVLSSAQLAAELFGDTDGYLDNDEFDFDEDEDEDVGHMPPRAERVLSQQLEPRSLTSRELSDYLFGPDQRVMTEEEVRRSIEGVADLDEEDVADTLAGYPVLTFRSSQEFIQWQKQNLREGDKVILRNFFGEKVAVYNS